MNEGLHALSALESFCQWRDRIFYQICCLIQYVVSRVRGIVQYFTQCAAVAPARSALLLLLEIIKCSREQCTMKEGFDALSAASAAATPFSPFTMAMTAWHYNVRREKKGIQSRRDLNARPSPCKGDVITNYTTRLISKG